MSEDRGNRIGDADTPTTEQPEANGAPSGEASPSRVLHKQAGMVSEGDMAPNGPEDPEMRRLRRDDINPSRGQDPDPDAPRPDPKKVFEKLDRRGDA
ncbi:MAG TPA: hypothetical protein VEY95_13295 [Azospirillaceae bacterium]|nr:hypothetical protein [Azospirillaceae bacterium]